MTDPTTTPTDPDPDLERIVTDLGEQADRSLTNDELLLTIEDLVRQFAYQGSRDGLPAYTTGGLSALEDAFAVLGWSDPQPAPEMACQHAGCGSWATGGTPTADGYKRLCHEHYRMARDR